MITETSDEFFIQSDEDNRNVETYLAKRKRAIGDGDIRGSGCL
jgi:hypothetical protein